MAGRRTARLRGGYAKSEETRERILAAALAVAGESGLHRTSVARIAERAGVAVGVLHYHFGSLEGLLAQLARWVSDGLLTEVDAAIAPQGTFFARDEAAFRAYLAYVARNPAYIRLVEEVRLHWPDTYRGAKARWLGMFRDAIREGVARGELRAMDEREIATLAHFLLGTRYFMDQLMQSGDWPGTEVAVAVYTRLVQAGVARPSRGGTDP